MGVNPQDDEPDDSMSIDELASLAEEAEASARVVWDAALALARTPEQRAKILAKMDAYRGLQGEAAELRKQADAAKEVRLTRFRREDPV